MTDDKEKKSIFEKAVDALTGKSEDEASEKAAQAAAKAKADAAMAKLKADKAKSEAEKIKAQAEAEKKKAASLEEAKKRAEELKDKVAKLKEEAAAKVIATHKVKKDETLSHIAQKYYKHATKPYYMLIYEANKAVIGNNPNLIKPDMELKIPELPADLK